MKIPLPLRSDLVIKKQIVGKATGYIIKDPVKQAYYRFDEEEYFVLSQLDGKKTVMDVAKAYNEQFQEELTGQDIAEFIGSLQRNDMFERTEIQKNVFLYEQLISQRKSRIQLAKGSPLYFRIPVVDPDKLFDKVMPFIRWIWSPLCVTLSIFFMLSAIGVLINNSAVVKRAMSSTFDFLNQDLGSLAVLWATVAIVIAIHELGHGLTCKRFSGECHEIGFLFMFFTPCMYANVNDAWMFENKRHRLYVTFAGCYIEFFVGSLAVYVWLFTQASSMVNIIAFKVVVVCFFSAIFMNFNPLMKFDGYFALSDAVEVPNLRSRSREYAPYLFQKYILRLEKEFEDLTKREQWILGIYGTLSTIYICNVMLGLMGMIGGALIKQFKIVGVIIMAAIVFKFLGGLIGKFINLIRMVMMEHEKFFGRKLIRLGGGGLIVGILLIVVFYPFPYHYKVSASLEPSREVVIRALSDGYVAPVSRHYEFQKGEVILSQENYELSLQKDLGQVDGKINNLLVQGALAKGDTTEAVKLKKVKQKLDEEIEELDRQQKNLTVYAPFKGYFTGNLDEFENTQVSQGDEIGRLFDPAVYEAAFDVLESDFEGIQEGMPAYLMLNMNPGKLFKGEVSRIASRHKQKGAARFYKVTVAFPNEDQLLRPGLKGKLFLNTGKYTVSQRIVLWLKKTISLDLQI